MAQRLKTDERRTPYGPARCHLVEAIAYGIGVVDNTEIDRINILRASILAMHRALDALSIAPGAVIVDGNRFTPWRDVPWQTLVKGDGRFGNIAAASVLAKTGRDAFMDEAAQRYPMYHWDSNKGYPPPTTAMPSPDSDLRHYTV